MNESIKRAIESICDDIATNTSADDNKKRAEAVTALAFCGLFAPEEIEGDEEEFMQREEPQTEAATRKAPAAGEHFAYNGIEFVTLGEEQGGVLAIVAKPLEDEMPLDKGNCIDWRKSTLRRYLNEEYIKNFDKADLLPFVSDLTTDSGQTDYGTSEDYIALLSCDLYRKYRKAIPKYDTWVWTLTPWHISPSTASFVRIVLTDGSLYSSSAYNSSGVAPACLFNPAIFE